MFSICAFLNAQAIALTNGNVTKAENAGTVTETYTVSSFSSDFTIILSIDSDNSTGTSGSDFSSTLIENYGTSNDGRIPVTGNGTFNVSYTIIDDNVDEENETLKILQTNTGGIATATKTVTITDNDDEPTMQFQASTANDDEDTGWYTVTVSLSHGSSRSTLPAYTISIGGGSTATGSGTDYNALNPTSYEFGSGSTTDQFSILIQDDALDENDETIIFSIASNNNTYAQVSGNTTHTVTIADNDAPPTIGFNAAAANATEGNSGTTAKTAQVDISAVSAKAISANYTVTGTSTKGGTDHNLANGSVSISAGNTNNTIGWNVIGEALYENNETIVITLSDPTNATLSSDVVHTYTITNDDTAPTIAFTGTAQSNNEATTSYDIGVTLSAASGLDATMDYAVQGSSTADGRGDDYTLADGTATVTAGNTTVNIGLTIVNDALYENDETIVVLASNPANSSLGSNTTFTYTIANNAGGNNDAKPSIQFNTATATGLESATSFDIQLDLSAASGLESTVDYALSGGSPAATGSGTDYTIADGTVALRAGETTANISATVVNDALDENDEKFVITISNPNSNVSLGTNQTYTYTIQDEDDPPTVQFNAVSSNETEGTNGTLKVDLSAASGKDVTVDYAVQASSTATGGGTDYTLADGTLTISAGSTTKNITITGVDDALDEDEETVIVLLSNPGNSSLGSNTTHTFTINDNDATPTVQFNSTTGSYAEGTEDHNIRLDLSAASGRDVEVAYTVAAGTPAATGSGTDYTLDNGTATFSAGATTKNLALKNVDDSLDEWEEKFVITLSNSPTNATTGSNNTHTATITDDDALPTIDFTSATSSVAESGTPKVLTANLSAASGKDIAVKYAISDGSPAATGSGTDYTLASDSLKISAGSTSQTISAVIVDDALDENNEKFIVTLTGSADNVTIGSTAPAQTVTITDNDDPPKIAFTALNASGNEAVTPVSIVAEISAVSGLDVSADYTITGTATGGNTDYSLADGTVSISAGSTTKTLSLTVVDDKVVEADETVIATLSNQTNSTLGTNKTHTYTIANDDSPPADFTVDTVIATGGTVRLGYWNSTNTGLRADIPVANTDDLVGGTIQLRAKKGILSYENLSDPYTIISSDKGTTKKMIATTAAQFEAITGFKEDSVITVTAVITDKYGNSTTGTESVNTLSIDQTLPDATPVVGAVTTSGGNVVANYWNSTNSSMNAVVDFKEDDPTLENGEILLTVSDDNVTFYDFGDTTDITGGIFNAGIYTVSVDSVITGTKKGLEEVAIFGEGDKLYFRAKVLDRAGNEVQYAVSTTILTVKQVLPTVNSVTSTNDNKAYKAGETLTIQTVISEAVTVTGTPKLKLETGTDDALISYASGSTSNTLSFTYPIVSPHTSDNLNYYSTDAIALSGGTILDVAGNPMTLTLPALDNANSLAKQKSIVIDTTPPSVTFTYDDPDTLVRFETGTLNIVATFSDSIQVDSIPKLSIDFPSVTAEDISNASMTRTSGKIYKYALALIDKSDGIINLSLSAYDKALNPLIADSLFREDVVTIDNTDPEAFKTVNITAMGDTTVATWLNSTTDSLQIKVPISSTDQSLLLGGDVNIQMRVQGKMNSATWKDIATSDASSPSKPADSIKQLGGDQIFYRNTTDILSVLSPLGLAQGDTIVIRGVINDKVGNITYGTQSDDFFVLDTLPPTIGKFIEDTLFTAGSTKTYLNMNRVTLWSNDTISFALKDWSDPFQTNEKASGVSKYEYALYQSADNNKNGTYSLFRDFKSQANGLDTVIVDTFALTHNRNYYVRVRGVDVAGNISVINTDASKSPSVLRYNLKPDVESVADVTAKEDVLWEHLLTVNDKDLFTLRSDTFTYSLESYFMADTNETKTDGFYTFKNPKIDTLNAAISSAGKLTFTPDKWDTTSYIHKVYIADVWGFFDTLDIKMLVIDVNDPPVLDLSSIPKLNFLEGANSDSINITRYASDEDNDTTSLKYSFRIASKVPANVGYPIAKIGFLSDFGKEYKKSFINKIVDEFPSSTIVQKNNSYLVYPPSVNNFKDPIKVDSLRATDSLFTWITPTDTTSADTNYYTETDMMVEFTVTDPGGLTGKDTITFFINPINDPPVWTGLRDTLIVENDSLYLDFANYLKDVDDSTLTISILPLTFGDNFTIEPAKTFQKKSGSYIYSSQARKDTVKFKPETLWFGPNGPWVKNNTDSTLIQITAADDDTTAIDTFVVKVQRVPRPEIRMYVVQNNAFTNYYEIFLVDSVGKTKDLTLEVQSKAVTLDTAAAFTYVGHYSFLTKGNYTFEVSAKGVVGDTVISKPVGLTLAKMYGTWSGRSVDGQFHVVGGNGSVDFDQSIMILDSTLFEPYFNDRASYLLGNEAYRFNKPVEISLPGQEEMAIYIRSTGSGWVELPSITEGSRVLAYSEKMGYFRVGPKTLVVPGQTSLQQNYPNPFNPSTTIEYDLGFVDGPFQKVNITVYDILGRNIKTLINEEQSIGRYRVKWDGKDQNGVPVSSGIYFVNLLTDMGRIKTKKVMLMR